jgi:hypothetical protein
MNTAPTRIPQAPSAIAPGAYVAAAGAPDNIPVLPSGPGDDEIGVAAVPPATAVARLWSAMGTPGRTAAAVVAVTAAVIGGVTPFRPAKRVRDAAAAAQETGEPIEFPLNP